MPDETTTDLSETVGDQPNAEASAAASSTEQRQETQANADPTGERKDDPVGDFFREFGAKAEPDQVKLWIEALPVETRDAALADYNARAEQSGRDKAYAEQQKQQRQAQEADEGVHRGRQAEQAFRSLLGEYDSEGRMTLEGRIHSLWRRAVDAVKDEDVGAVKEALVAIEPYLLDDLPLIFAMYGEGKRRAGLQGAAEPVYAALAEDAELFEKAGLTPAEEQALKEARAADEKAGTNTRTGKLVRLIIDRKVIAGREKLREEALKQARTELGVFEAAERVQGMSGKIPPKVNGRVAQTDKAITEEMKSIDVTTPEGQAEWVRRQPEFKRRLDALNSK